MVCGVSPAVSPVAALRSLARQLSERAWVVSIKVIETARVPVIKALAALPPSSAALCEGSQLQLDVSLEGLDHTGAASTRLMRDVFCANLPVLRPMVLVLKQVAACPCS